MTEKVKGGPITPVWLRGLDAALTIPVSIAGVVSVLVTNVVSVIVTNEVTVRSLDTKSALMPLIAAQVFNNVTTAVNSVSVACEDYRFASLAITLDAAGAPEYIHFIPQFSWDNVNWYSAQQMPQDQIRYEDTEPAAATIHRNPWFRCTAPYFRLRIEAVGTTAGDTFTTTVGVAFQT